MAFIEPMHRNKPNITYLLTTVDMKKAQPMWNGDSNAVVKQNHHIDCFTV